MIVIGVGNEFRRDDGAGLEVARRLLSCSSGRATIIAMAGDAAELIQAWEGQGAVILIDAIASDHEPGTVLRFDATQSPLAADLFGLSSHSFGVHAAVELARALGRLPEQLIIYGIVGGDFSEGVGLSEPVESAVFDVVEILESADS